MSRYLETKVKIKIVCIHAYVEFHFLINSEVTITSKLAGTIM